MEERLKEKKRKRVVGHRRSRIQARTRSNGTICIQRMSASSFFLRPSVHLTARELRLDEEKGRQLVE